MRKLNVNRIQEVMLEKGMSQQAIAEALDLSKATISGWLKPEKFPRPQHLLSLSKLLEIPYKELIIADSNKPMVAFRRNGNFKVTSEHHDHFQYIARLLEKLVPYLPYDIESAPSTLKDAKLDYSYIQQVAGRVRSQIVEADGIIKFESLINFFTDLQAVLVPVLWGDKAKKHATHIYLPESSTTWVFINLDSKIHDFKFWLAHELAHAKAPYLNYDDGEDFADKFAGAMLFPEELAAEAYKDCSAISNEWKRFEHIAFLATKLVISPVTIYYQLEHYAKNYDFPSLDLEKVIHPGNAQFNQGFPLLSKGLFEEVPPSGKLYVETANKCFSPVFFETLKQFLNNTDVNPNKFVSNLLDISLEDSWEIVEALMRARNAEKEVTG